MSRLPNKPIFTLRGREIPCLDAAAAVLFFAFAVYYVFLSFRSVAPADEGMYLTVPYRMMMGDKLILDEWHVSMFSGIFEYLPLKVFVAVTGGTAGVVRFFRLLYTVCKLVCCVYLYTNYRRYKAAALIGIAAFLAYDAFGSYTLSYYTMSVMGMLIVTTELASPKKKSMARLIFVGVVFACVVLIEPFSAFLYFFYTALVAARWLAHKRNKYLFSAYGFVINERFWRGLTVGIALSATAFLLVFVAAKWKEVTLALPELFTDNEYDLLDPRRFLEKLYGYLSFLNINAALQLMTVDVILCVVLAVRRKKERENRAVMIWFAASCAVFIGSAALYLRMAATTDMASMLSGFTLHCLTSLGWKCFFLTHKKNHRLFFVFLTGILFSFFLDFSSHASLWVSLTVSTLAAPVFVKTAVEEISQEGAASVQQTVDVEKHTKNNESTNQKHSFKTRTVLLSRVILTVSVASGIAMCGFSLYARATQPLVESIYLGESLKDAVVIQEGPLKGIRTSKTVKDRCEAAIADMDLIKAKTDAPVYVANCCCWYYLYLDLPFSAYSAWYSPVNRARQLRWWELHPEKLPGTIYLPYFDCDHYERDEDRINAELDFLRDCYDFEQEEGQAGYILRVTGVHFPS